MTVHIRLEIRDDVDEFEGRVISDEGSRDFHGWLGLIGALEAMCPEATTKEEPVR